MPYRHLGCLKGQKFADKHMEIYQHDEVGAFRFELRGRLEGDWVDQLEHAWLCAMSILKDKKLVIDISWLTGGDERGILLLQRMKDSGADFLTCATNQALALVAFSGTAEPTSKIPRHPSVITLLRKWIARLRNRLYPLGHQ